MYFKNVTKKKDDELKKKTNELEKIKKENEELRRCFIFLF
jgi:hypothetical protein